MMVVVFRARRTEAGDGDEYKHQFQRMAELARKMPGYISHKPFVAEDGERLTLFEWESSEILAGLGSASRACAGQGAGSAEVLCRVPSSGLRGHEGVEIHARCRACG